MANVLLASMVVAIWVYLLLGRGGFWLGRERDDPAGTEQGPWPAIVSVIPARDEAESVGRTTAGPLPTTAKAIRPPSGTRAKPVVCLIGSQ